MADLTCTSTPQRVQYLAVDTLSVCKLIQPVYNLLNAAQTFDSSAPVITLSRPGAAGTLTLPAPINPSDNGRRLTIVTTTAFAHVVAGPLTDETGVNRATATFNNPAAAVGLTMTLVAANGRWYVISQRGVTYA